MLKLRWDRLSIAKITRPSNNLGSFPICQTVWRLQWWIAGTPSVNLQSLSFSSLLFSKRPTGERALCFAQRPLIADFLHRIDCLVSSYRCTLEYSQGIFLC